MINGGSLFPLKSQRLKVNNLMSACAKEVTSLQKKTKVVKPSKATIQDTAKQIYFKIDEPFKSLYNVNLAEALTKVPEIGVTQSKTKAQKQKERMESLRSIKRKTEDQWSKVHCDNAGNAASIQAEGSAKKISLLRVHP